MDQKCLRRNCKFIIFSISCMDLLLVESLKKGKDEIDHSSIGLTTRILWLIENLVEK